MTKDRAETRARRLYTAFARTVPGQVAIERAQLWEDDPYDIALDLLTHFPGVCSLVADALHEHIMASL